MSVNIQLFNPGCGSSLSLSIYPRQSLNLFLLQYCYKFFSKKLSKPEKEERVPYHIHTVPKFVSTYFFQKQNFTKVADCFWNKGNHNFWRLLLKDTNATLNMQTCSLISTAQSSPLSHIRMWVAANGQIEYTCPRPEVCDWRRTFTETRVQWTMWSHGWSTYMCRLHQKYVWHTTADQKFRASGF